MSTDTIIMEETDNLQLIENGLLHVAFELGRDEPSYFRLARESHLILYRAMIETLRGSDGSSIVGRPTGDRSTKYQIGDAPWQEIHRVSIPGSSNAWRFSSPTLCS